MHRFTTERRFRCSSSSVRARTVCSLRIGIDAFQRASSWMQVDHVAARRE